MTLGRTNMKHTYVPTVLAPAEIYIVFAYQETKFASLFMLLEDASLPSLSYPLRITPMRYTQHALGIREHRGIRNREFRGVGSISVWVT